MRYMKVSVVVMAAISAVLLALTIWQSTGQGSANLFQNYGVFVLLLVFCAIQLLCIFSRKFQWKRLGSYMLHLGIVLFLVGNGLYFLFGQKVYVDVPVDPNATYSTIKQVNGQPLHLGFELGIADFHVSKYPPDENGYEADKFFVADLVIYEKGNPERQTYDLYVNGPHWQNGWKIYLMSYHQSTDGLQVSLLLKRNPGEWLTIAGLFMLLAGTFVVCFGKPRDTFREPFRGKSRREVAA